MNQKTIIALGRLAAGAAIMITSMVTGENGSYQMLSLLLMGLPVEVLATAKGKNSKDKS